MFRKLLVRLSGHIYLLHVLIILVLVGTLLSLQAWQRTDRFRQHHLQLATTSVTGTAEDLEILFSELQRSMRLFTADRLDLFEEIMNQPDNDALWQQLERAVSNYFPEYFGLTLTDASGNVMRPDFDNHVDASCQQDIQRFIEHDQRQQGYIHPNPLGYHFDIMVPWGTPDQPLGIFFLSFNPDMLARILQRMQLPGHELLLVRSDQPGLIEITAQGSRKQLQGDFFISPEDMLNLGGKSSISGTRWNLLDLISPALLHVEALRNWIYAALVFAGFTGISFLMLYQLKRKELRRLEAEAQVLEHQSDLAHVDRLNIMGEMASSLAHEINQPLSAISTYCQAGLRIIETTGDKPEKLVHALEQSSLQAQRAGKIVHRMQRFGSKSKAKRNATDINEIILNAVGFVETELTRQGISLRLDLMDNLPAITADGIQIEQVIINLLHNAIEALTQAGTAAPLVTLASHRSANLIEVAVHDNGPGLDDTMIDTMFDAFFTTKTDGMGLGLAISRSIIEAHGGQLHASASPASGTTLYFTLPLNEK